MGSFHHICYSLFASFVVVSSHKNSFMSPKIWAPGKNRPPPSAFRLAENGKKRPIHGKSAQGVTEP